MPRRRFTPYRRSVIAQLVSDGPCHHLDVGVGDFRGLVDDHEHGRDGSRVSVSDSNSNAKALTVDRCPGRVPPTCGSTSGLTSIADAPACSRCSVASVSAAGQLRILSSITSTRRRSALPFALISLAHGASWWLNWQMPAPLPPMSCRQGSRRPPGVPHGLYRYEYHRCRCEVCKAANSVASARKRRRLYPFESRPRRPTRILIQHHDRE